LTIDPVTATNADDLAPRPVDDSETTDEVTAINVDVLANDKGLDKGVKSVSIATAPDADKGTATINTDKP